LPAERGELPGRQERVWPALVPGPELVRRAEPGWGKKGVAWSGLRVAVLPNQAVEA